jgi:hypothetical protein
LILFLAHQGFLWNFPPVIGCWTPVVVGNDSGNPLRERTAR